MTETQPYVSRSPGDPVTAEDWNDVQVQVKGDIAAQIAAAKADIVKTGVDHAGDADKFFHRSDTQWLAELDKRYAMIGHQHEGPYAYRRYLKHFSTDPGLDEVLLEHNLGAFPLIDIYELAPVTNGTNGTGDAKLFFYYGHADEEKYGLSVRVGRDRVRLGLHFERVLAELRVEYTDDSSIGDVVNDMWDALRRDPNDELPHGQSAWIDECCGEARTVAELKRTQQWDDLYLAIKPRKVTLLHGSGTPQGALPFTAQSMHVDYDTIWLQLTGLGQDDPAGGVRNEVDLMILLRS
jgi:hypothetical protein